MKRERIIIFVISIICLFSFLLWENHNETFRVENYDVLVLVNRHHKIPDDYNIHLVLFDGYKIAKAIITDLQHMYQDAREDNIFLGITSTYRSFFEQKNIFDSKVSEHVLSGYSKDEAKRMAKTIVADPGYSEHETGLAIDFSNGGSYDEKMQMWDWLRNHAHQYGFILRYPADKVNITGYDYEPWHYRYVGIENAQKIYQSGLCLEEYLTL